MIRSIWLILLILTVPSSGFSELRTEISIRGKPQRLYLYGTRGNSPVILSSGDLGWVGLVEHVAEFLSGRGYYIVGVNSRAYLSSFTTQKSALNPQDVPRDYQVLIDFTRQGGATKPVLAGVSEGAGLSALAATEPSVKAGIKGVLALGLPNQNELGWKWQDFTIWITKKAPDEPSFMIEDIIHKVSPIPLAEIHSSHDEFLPLGQAKAMFSRAGEPKKMWVIEAANHRFSDNRDELDRRILEALAWIENARH